MAKPTDENSGDAGLVFAAYNTHHEPCGPSPRLRNTESPGLYYGYFENRYGEQFVFTFDRATGTGTVSGGDLGWGGLRAFTLGQLEAADRDTQRGAAPIGEQGLTEMSGWQTIDAGYSSSRSVPARPSGRTRPPR